MSSIKQPISAPWWKQYVTWCHFNELVNAAFLLIGFRSLLGHLGLRLVFIRACLERQCYRFPSQNLSLVLSAGCHLGGSNRNHLLDFSPYILQKARAMSGDNIGRHDTTHDTSYTFVAAARQICWPLQYILWWVTQSLLLLMSHWRLIRFVGSFRFNSWILRGGSLQMKLFSSSLFFKLHLLYQHL